MGLLSDKVAVITGGGRGIGRSVALAYAAEGASVVIAARSDDELDRVCGEIRSRGGKCLPCRTDVTQQEDVDALFALAQKEFGGVDILVNNAGVLGPIDNFWDTDIRAWQELMDVNVIGVVRCTQAALRSMMVQRSGKIINVGSDAARSDGWAAGNYEHTGYAASKAAVIRLTEVLALQARSWGITVNCVGVWADTQMSFDARRALAELRGGPPFDESALSETVDPDESVLPFVFLASAMADHLTGQYFEANSFPGFMRNGK